MSEHLVRDALETSAALFAVLLITAGVAKFEGLPGWARLVNRFPVSTAQKRFLLIGVPLVEIAVGVLIIVRPKFGLGVAALLLVAFAAGVKLFLNSLRGAECRCFGNLSVSEIDTGLVIRDLVLAGLAAAVAVGAWTSNMTFVSPFPLLAIGLLALVTVVVGGYRSLSRIQDGTQYVGAGAERDG